VLRSAHEMSHSYRFLIIRSSEGGVEGNAANVAAGDRKPGKHVDLELLGRRLHGENAPPDFGALRLIGKRKLHDESQPTEKGAVECVFHVSRENGQPAISLHPLQQIADLDVGVTIVAVFHLAAFAKERIGLVEEEHGAAFLGGIENAAQIFLGLADVFAHDRTEIDAEKIEPHFVRQNFGGQCFASAAWTAEERAQPQATI